MPDNTQAEDILNQEDFKRIIENLLFITDRPLSIAKISQTAQINNLQLTRDIVATLQNEYIQTARAIQIVEIGGGFQMATKPEYGRWVRRLFNEKLSAKLSNAALETLAIVAYKQPVTRAEIESIRGVDAAGPLEKIMERGLVRIVGKKDTPGRPMVYGTTDEFLRLFGLNKLTDLPELKDFADKGPRQLQGDLPFTEVLPQAKDNIIPLEEGDELEIMPDVFKPLPKVKDDIIVSQDGSETEGQSIEEDDVNYAPEPAQNTATEQERQEAQQNNEEQPSAAKSEELVNTQTDNGDLQEDMQIDDIKI